MIGNAEKDVLRYIYLVDRRLTILTSGVHWKAEYETELEDIDRELSELRFLVDEEHGKRMKKVDNPKATNVDVSITEVGV